MSAWELDGGAVMQRAQGDVARGVGNRAARLGMDWGAPAAIRTVLRLYSIEANRITFCIPQFHLFSLDKRALDNIKPAFIHSIEWGRLHYRCIYMT